MSLGENQKQIKTTTTNNQQNQNNQNPQPTTNQTINQKGPQTTKAFWMSLINYEQTSCS